MNTMQKYINARLLTVQAVYAHEQTHEDWEKIKFRFICGDIGGKVLTEKDNREEEIMLGKADIPLFKNLIQEIIRNGAVIDDMLRQIISEKTDYDKLELVFKCILKVAVAEFYTQPDLPTPIIINEYVDMTRAFFNGDEPSMMNIVLRKAAQTIR